MTTPTQRCIEAAIEGIDEDCDRASDDFELELMGAPDLPEPLRDALLQRFLADLRECRDRHVARINQIFAKRTTDDALPDETVH